MMIIFMVIGIKSLVFGYKLTHPKEITDCNSEEMYDGNVVKIKYDYCFYAHKFTIIDGESYVAVFCKLHDSDSYVYATGPCIPETADEDNFFAGKNYAPNGFEAAERFTEPLEFTGVVKGLKSFSDAEREAALKTQYTWKNMINNESNTDFRGHIYYISINRELNNMKWRTLGMIFSMVVCFLMIVRTKRVYEEVKLENEMDRIAAERNEQSKKILDEWKEKSHRF